MKLLITDWKRVLLIGYSTWAFIAAALCFSLPDLIYYVAGIDTNPVVWGRLGLMFTAGGLIGRLIEQDDETKWHRRIVVGIVLIAAASLSLPAIAEPTYQPARAESFDDVAFPLISRWEGKKLSGDRHIAYFDIVDVPTRCYGHTRTVTRAMVYRGDTWSESECRALLIEEIADYRDRLSSYYTARTVLYRLPVRREAAYVSLAYNVGVVRAGRSTAMRRLNRGDIKGGCAALAWWNKAGGRVVRGLVNRRRAEVSLCFDGLDRR